MGEDKKVIITIFSDSETNAYTSDSQEEAMSYATVKLKNNSQLGVKARIYNLTDVKHKTVSLKRVIE